MRWHAEDAWHEADPATLDVTQKIAVIIDTLDSGRIGISGGYPSEYIIENGTLYWATMSASKDYNAPSLEVVRDLEQFVSDYDWVFDDT